MRASLFLLTLSAAACSASTTIKLVSFDGSAGTVGTFTELNDPVMGGKSSGTFTVVQKYGVFDGQVLDVPSLKAPGFIKAAAAGKFPDASAAAGGALVLKVRSSTPEYQGFRVAFASGTLAPAYACGGGGSLPFSRGCFKAKFTVAAGSDFSTVTIPFDEFSDKWSPATGEQTTTCAKDSDVCPIAKNLEKILRVEVWAEGADGHANLEIESISAVSAAEPAALGTVADACHLYAIEGGNCGESVLDCKYAKYAKLARKDLKDGTCASQGYTSEKSTFTKNFPVVGAVTVTEYTKTVAVAVARPARLRASAAGAGKNIVELAASVSDLSTLVTALKAASLTAALSAKGPFTVFAPTNEAFDALPKATLAFLLDPKNIKDLQALLEYHVIAGSAIRSSDLRYFQKVKTLEGEDEFIFKYHGTVTVNHSRVVKADVEATNGVVHVIDRVLVPFSHPVVNRPKQLRTFRSVGAWSGGGNGATAVKGATTLAEGAATTFKTFAAALDSCTRENCDVFFNFHTKYSFAFNAGAYGLARAQLEKDDRCDGKIVKCFRLRGEEPATSDNTNLVTGLPHQLPAGAGKASARLYWRFPFGEGDLSLDAQLTTDAGLADNAAIIGAHLHTGSEHVNGPVNIVFCGSAPLPAPLQLNGDCRVF